MSSFKLVDSGTIPLASAGPLTAILEPFGKINRRTSFDTSDITVIITERLCERESDRYVPFNRKHLWEHQANVNG